MFVGTFVYGCTSQKKAEDHFLKMSNDFYFKYCHAQSPEAAINTLKDYLAEVEIMRNPRATKVRYDKGRGFAEARISLIYDQLGDNQNASIFLEQALRDMQKDPYYIRNQPYDKRVDEEGLKQAVLKIDSWNSIDWKKSTDRNSK